MHESHHRTLVSQDMLAPSHLPQTSRRQELQVGATGQSALTLYERNVFPCFLDKLPVRPFSASLTIQDFDAMENHFR